MGFHLPNSLMTMSTFPSPRVWLFLSVLFLVACSDQQASHVKTEWTKTELDALNIYAVAGDYYEINMGVKGNQITGIYRPPAQPNCWFFFEGTLGTENPIAIECYDPSTTHPPIQGTLKIVGDAIIAQLPRLPHQDCPNELTDDIGYSMVLDLQHSWSTIRVVEHPALLYAAPDLETEPMKVPIPAGTAVGILEKRGTWLRVEALQTTTSFPSLWIQEHQLYPLLN